MTKLRSFKLIETKETENITIAWTCTKSKNSVILRFLLKETEKIEQTDPENTKNKELISKVF